MQLKNIIEEPTAHENVSYQFFNMEEVLLKDDMIVDYLIHWCLLIIKISKNEHFQIIFQAHQVLLELGKIFFLILGLSGY